MIAEKGVGLFLMILDFLVFSVQRSILIDT